MGMENLDLGEVFMLTSLCPPLSCAAAKARGSSLRVHFKHMREVAHLIKGMKLSKSKQYLQVRKLCGTQMARLSVLCPP